MWTIMNLRLKRDRRGVSNIIVVALSLVIIIAIVSNIVLWSYEMNQLDWEKMKEDMTITNVERVTHSSWFVTQSEYTVNIGSRISGTYTDTQTVDDQYERFRETLPGAPQWEYAESLSESSSSSTSFTEKVRLTFTPSSIGDWLVIITFQARHTNTGDSFEVRGQLDDDSAKIICLPNQEPEINDPTREYRTFGHFRVFQNLSTSEHHIDVDYRTQDLFTTMYIKNVRIVAIQIEDIDNVKNAYAEYENQVSNPGSGFTDYAEATITPTDDNKKYLIIGGAEVQPSYSSFYYSEARISVDDTSYYPEEAPTGVYFRSTTKDTGDWFPLMTSAVVTLSSGSHTVAYQLKGASYADFRRIRIFVMRLDDLYTYEYVRDGSETSTTSTSWQTKSTLSFTSSASDYLIISTMSGQLDDSGDSFQNRFTIGGSSEIDHFEEQSEGSYRSMQFAAIKTLAAEAQTFETEYRTLSSFDVARVKASSIVAIKKPSATNNYGLDVNGAFVVDVSTYPLDSIQTVEIQLRYMANDTGEKWYLKSYNWSSSTYSNSGFNSTAGHTPTTGWDYYVVNLTDEWRSYVQNNGTIYVKFVDQGADSNQTTIDIDFLGVRAKIDGTRFTFKNEGALTSHLVSLWIINSTNHQRYDINVFVNSAETTTYLRADISLPTGQYTVKVVTERGNTAVYSGS